MSAAKPKSRQRSSSVTNALRQVPLNSQSHESKESSDGEVKPLPAGPPRKKRKAQELPENYRSLGFWTDLKTGRWMLVPSSAFILLVVQFALFASTEYIVESHNVQGSDKWSNPFRHLLFPGYKQVNGTYRKGWGDLAFVFDHIIFWSFVRQIVTIHILRPLAKYLGIKGGKIMRFTEQGYALFYFGITGPVGIYVMRGLPTFWYKTEHYWLNYPHSDLTWELKTYYLLQASYWMQQLILLVGRVEKPRKDFTELVAHHIVTLWLIGWSYTVHLTYIGNAIYVSMDVSDIFLALAKCVNYVNETASVPIFAFFVWVWTYFRHYLNIKILWSVYTEFDLIPESERTYFLPLQDRWMPPWMKWQIFIPILLLQFINLFWYFLILRILVRAVLSKPVKDSRSDDEDEEEMTTEDRMKALKGEKVE